MVACEGLGNRLRNIEDQLAHPIIGATERLVLSDISCDPSLSILDLVIADTTSHKVIIVNSNKKTEIPRGVLGVVLSKQSATKCTILIRGRISGFSGLQIGKHLFVSTAGWFTHDVPDTGVVQLLAVALSNEEIMYDPHSPYKRAIDT